MDQVSEKLFDFFSRIPKSYYLPVGILFISLIFFGIGLMQLSGSHTQNEVLPASTQDEKATVSAKSTFGLIKVDVEGAVVHPGVYELANSSRVQDALVAAGGLSSIADRITVEQRINLASKLTDGMKIYIPDMSQKGTVNNSSTIDYSGAQVHLIDINSAGESELDSLPGIGAVTAQKIISGRPYNSVSELLSKKIISNSVYQKIKDLVTAY